MTQTTLRGTSRGLRHPHRTRALVLIGLGTLVAGSLTPLGGHASSHREAPLIAKDPPADNTDLYAFRSPDDPSTVTIVANYFPFESPPGGPNFYPFADDVTYTLHIDPVGDGQDHLDLNFNFSTTTVNPGTFLYNVGPISFNAAHTPPYDNWNRPQTYNVTLVNAGAPTVLNASPLYTPPDAVGTTSEPDYPGLSQHGVYALPLPNGAGNAQVFAGQRDDPFFVDLGGIFDLLDIGGGEDYAAGLNVKTIAVKLPISFLDNGSDHVIGVWASASRAQTTVLNLDGTKSYSGGQVQVSRLGNPLVNEAISNLAVKDQYNAQTPAGDGALLGNLTLNPELAHLLNVVFNAGAPEHNRGDLVAALLTGVPGLNKPSSGKAVMTDELRLNMSVPETHPGNVNGVKRLGVLAGEADGFPNGRRLADDVADIEIQVVDGILCQPGAPFAGANPCRIGSVPSGLGDGVDHNDVPFSNSFPYLAPPHIVGGS